MHYQPHDLPAYHEPVVDRHLDQDWQSYDDITRPDDFTLHMKAHESEHLDRHYITENDEEERHHDERHYEPEYERLDEKEHESHR